MSFCGAQNEDWMKICQECGNPVIDTAKRETKEEEKMKMKMITIMRM